MQVLVPLVRTEQLSVDGVRVFTTFAMNAWKPITDRSDLGQAVKTLESLAGIKKTVNELTWRLAKRTRSIHRCRE